MVPRGRVYSVGRLDLDSVSYTEGVGRMSYPPPLVGDVFGCSFLEKRIHVTNDNVLLHRAHCVRRAIDAALFHALSDHAAPHSFLNERLNS